MVAWRTEAKLREWVEILITVLLIHRIRQVSVFWTHSPFREHVRRVLIVARLWILHVHQWVRLLAFFCNSWEMCLVRVHVLRGLTLTANLF